MKNTRIIKKATAAVLAVVMVMSITAFSFAITAANTKLKEETNTSATNEENCNSTINNALVRSLLSAHRKRES